MIRCFNPYRVFKFVATLIALQSDELSSSGFNPYRVFKFVATTSYFSHWQLQLSVSIPIGFSSSLQHHIRDLIDLEARLFQSLSGFQVRCNGSAMPIPRYPQWCFNPYRVFKFVATSWMTLYPVRWKTCFNPYRVFKFVATA